MNAEQSKSSEDRMGTSVPVLLPTSVIVTLLITAIDIWSPFLYVPYWLLAAVVAAPALGSLAFSFSRARAGLVVILLGWMLALPYLRWNNVKSFFIDCQRIEVGMSVPEAKALMSSYRLQIETNGKTRIEQRLERPHITFHPSLDRSADWCVVYKEEGRVVEVDAVPN